MQYFWVRALTTGPWRGVDMIDANNQKIGERTLIMAFQNGKWCIDNRSVDVEPGLIVSFRDYEDAMWFVQQDRGRSIAVEPGNILPFESQSDADFFVRKGLAEILSRTEVEQYLEWLQEQRQQQLEGDEVDQPELENKKLPKPESSKAKPHPKPAPSKGKGKK